MKNPKKHTLRIGLVLSAVPGYSETFFRNKIKGLQDLGFDVVLFVDYANKSDGDFPCPVIASPDFSGYSVKTFMNGCKMLFTAFFIHPRRSFKLFQLDRGDGVSLKKSIRHLILYQFLLTRDLDWLHFGFGILAVGRENVAQAIGAQMAVSFRGYDLYLSPLKHPDCYRLLFKKDVQYHVLSNGMRETLQDYGIDNGSIHIIHPAINTSFFSTDAHLLRDQNEPLKIVSVARLHWKKGLEYTLEALAILKQKGVVFQYRIIGEGDQLERLIFAAHQLELLTAVTFTGKLSPQDVKKHLSEAHLYLQYSIQEGFCNSVLEAQSMGKLTIVSDAEGLDENVLDGITGWVVPKRDPKALAEKIVEVMHMPEAVQHLIRQQAIQRVQDHFNLTQQHTAFLEFYTQNRS